MIQDCRQDELYFGNMYGYVLHLETTKKLYDSNTSKYILCSYNNAY